MELSNKTKQCLSNAILPMNVQLIVLTNETSPLLDVVFYSETDILVKFF